MAVEGGRLLLSELLLKSEAPPHRLEYVRHVSRIPTLARRHGFDVLIVIGAVEGALEAALRQDAVLEPGTTAWVVIPVVPFVVLPLLMRRRYPFAAPLAVWLIAAGLSSIDGKLVTSIGVLFAAGMAAAFLLGNLQNAVEGRIGLVVTLAAAAIVVYNDPNHGGAEFLVTPGLFAIAWLAGFALRERSAQAESSEERALEAERELLAERVRIARELHDVLAHSLSQINVQAGVGLHLMDKQPDKAKEALASIKETSKTALDEVRTVLGVLRAEGGADPNAPLVPEPDLSRLPGLVASMTTQGLEVRLDDRLGDENVPKPVQLALYRIAQESLTNITRHAEGATRATISLERRDDVYRLEVRDDGAAAGSGGAAGGASATAPESGGRGLLGMRERAELLGGHLTAGPADGGGFEVVAELPASHDHQEAS